MSTVALNAISKAYPDITNRIRAAVYLETAPNTIVASIIDIAVGHPTRTWNFLGLDRANYKFSLDEIDLSGNVLTNLALFSVVPGQLEGTLGRADEQIKVDSTPGLVSGANGFIFDGTGGKPNYIGFEIVPSELTGRGILAKDLDYSWDKDTGIFSLLQAGDEFAPDTYWHIHFDNVDAAAGNSTPLVTAATDFGIRLITASTTLTAADFGTKVIIEPAASYMEITLPDIVDVIDGRRLMVEISNSAFMCCVKFLTASTINFLRGNLYALPNESFSVYRFTRSAGVYEWRVCDINGNFSRCGETEGEDMNVTGVFNKQRLDGSRLLATQYARIYNEIVLNLPLSQKVNYDSWSIGSNKYLFSLANSSDPVNTGYFFFPDRRGLYEKNTNAEKAGTFTAAGFATGATDISNSSINKYVLL